MTLKPQWSVRKVGPVSGCVLCLQLQNPPYYRSLKSSFDFCMVLITVSGVDQEAEVGDDLIQDPIAGTEGDIHAVQKEEDLGQGLDQDPVQGLDQDPGIE